MENQVEKRQFSAFVAALRSAPSGWRQLENRLALTKNIKYHIYKFKHMNNDFSSLSNFKHESQLR